MAEAIHTFNVHIANYTNIDVCKDDYLHSDCLCILLFAQSLYVYRVISTLMYVLNAINTGNVCLISYLHITMFFILVICTLHSMLIKLFIH